MASMAERHSSCLKSLESATSCDFHVAPDRIRDGRISKARCAWGRGCLEGMATAVSAALKREADHNGKQVVALGRENGFPKP